MFAAGTDFGVILARYLFDQRLRSHLMEAFSFIEVSIRTQWAHQLTHGFGHGDYAHQNPALFNQYHTSNLSELQRSYQSITKNKGPSFGIVGEFYRTEPENPPNPSNLTVESKGILPNPL